MDGLTMPLPGVPVIKRRADAKHANNAAKQQAYRDAKQFRHITIQLPAELDAKLNAFLAAKGKEKEKSAIIAKLIETQLLRKR